MTYEGLIRKKEWKKREEKTAAIIAILDRYTRLDRALTEKYRRKLQAADPRVGLQDAFHLTHNWGNEEAQGLLAHYSKLVSRLGFRRRNEVERAERKFA